MRSMVISYAVLLLCVGINAKTCLEQVQDLEASPLLGAFKPICNPDGTYAELQSHEGYFFCVFPTTGEEILGTKIRGEKPKSCKATPCLIQRHEGLFHQGLVGLFTPECEKDGSFKKIQCHGSTGYCYCVVPESGEKIFGTEIRGRPTNCEIDGLNNTKKCFKDLKSLQEKGPLLGAFKPICQPNGLYQEIQSHEGYFFCVVPITGEEILGTKIRGAKPKSCKATPCLMQRHHALLNSQNGMVGHFEPKCNEDGSFTKIQCHASIGFCYCVNTETGIKFEGTEVRGKPDCEKAGLNNAKKCLAEVNALQGKKPLLGAFKPVCQPNGLYQETQCHEGYCYCVFPETGDEIMGTRVRFNKPKSCKATTCFTKRHYAMQDSKSGMVGHFTPECDENGAFLNTQCHASTGFCFCVMSQSGEKVLGTEIRFKKPKSCQLTECVYQRHLALKSHLLGVFKPICDENGAYSSMQCHVGVCFCVFPENGREILGSRLSVGQKPISCEMTTCMQKRHDFLSAIVPIFGAFKPECTSDGKYNPTQCREGVCYCVFTDSGEEILGTITRFYKPKTCKLTPCVLERHKGWVRAQTGFLGVPISRCDENGMYAKVQCRKGLCWCVDPKTGKPIKGKAPQFTVPDC